MNLTFEGHGHTSEGRRADNQDAYRIEPELGLYLVADGMGGYEGGEVASHMVVDTIAEFFRLNAEDSEVTWPEGGRNGLSPVENMVNVSIGLVDIPETVEADRDSDQVISRGKLDMGPVKVPGRLPVASL